MRAEQKSLGRLRFQGAESEIVATGIWGLWGSWGGQPPPTKNTYRGVRGAAPPDKKQKGGGDPPIKGAPKRELLVLLLAGKAPVQPVVNKKKHGWLQRACTVNF